MLHNENVCRYGTFTINIQSDCRGGKMSWLIDSLRIKGYRVRLYTCGETLNNRGAPCTLHSGENI